MASNNTEITFGCMTNEPYTQPYYMPGRIAFDTYTYTYQISDLKVFSSFVLLLSLKMLLSYNLFPTVSIGFI